MQGKDEGNRGYLVLSASYTCLHPHSASHPTVYVPLVLHAHTHTRAHAHPRTRTRTHGHTDTRTHGHTDTRTRTDTHAHAHFTTQSKGGTTEIGVLFPTLRTNIKLSNVCVLMVPST